MSESCFTSEAYALYAIGSLDGEELSELESHVRRGCGTCRAEIDQARQLWYAFAAATPLVAPSGELKQRILAAVQPARLRLVERPTTNRWMQAAAAALMLGAGFAVGWRMHRPAAMPAAPAPQVAQSTPAADQDTIDRLRAQIAELNTRVSDREREIKASAVRAQSAADLERTVAALQAEVSGRAQILQEAQSRAAQLQSEVQRLRDQAAASDARAREAEQRYTTAASERQQALDRESRLRMEYTARIRQLESENQKFQRVIDEQQKKIQQNVQLASFYASPNLRFYQYKGTKNGPGATAHVVALEGSRVLFYAFHMPQLPAGRTYQLWLIRGQGPAIVSGGIFQVDRDGNAVVEFTNPTLTRDVRQFAVTDEPASGSPGPTGNQFFRAS